MPFAGQWDALLTHPHPAFTYTSPRGRGAFLSDGKRIFIYLTLHQRSFFGPAFVTQRRYQLVRYHASAHWIALKAERNAADWSLKGEYPLTCLAAEKQGGGADWRIGLLTAFCSPAFLAFATTSMFWTGRATICNGARESAISLRRVDKVLHESVVGGYILECHVLLTVIMHVYLVRTLSAIGYLCLGGHVHCAVVTIVSRV
ncbi:hypothetical protein V8C44DRAFT_100046 [Trichoderma aethiopicum]